MRPAEKVKVVFVEIQRELSPTPPPTYTAYTVAHLLTYIAKWRFGSQAMIIIVFVNIIIVNMFISASSPVAWMVAVAPTWRATTRHLNR